MSTSNIAVVIWIITARSRSTMRKSFIRLSINESCRRLWTSHVIHEWVMSHMSRVSDLSSGYLSMSRVVGYERVMSYMTQSCHIWVVSQIFHQIMYQWVVSSVTNESCHTWISHVTYESCLRSFIRLSINESCRRLWTSHVTLISHVTYESCLRSFITLSINELCRVWTSHVIHESVMSHMSYVTDLPSGYIRMSHVTHEWVTSHINESYHVWMSHLTYEWVMSHTNELCHVWMSHVIYEWVISHIICQVVRKWIEEYCSQTNESCYIWMSHITYNKWYASEWVMSLHNANESRSTVHRQMSHVTYEWVMSHTIKHTQVNESCHCTSHRYTYLDGRSDSFICSMTHS